MVVATGYALADTYELSALTSEQRADGCMNLVKEDADYGLPAIYVFVELDRTIPDGDLVIIPDDLNQSNFGRFRKLASNCKVSAGYGEPSIVPKVSGQFYIDQQDSNKLYISTGINPGNWAAFTNIPEATTTNLGTLQLSGDLGGTSVLPIVTKVQGRAFDNTEPIDEQVWKWSAASSSWKPTTFSTRNNDVAGFPIDTAVRLSASELKAFENNDLINILPDCSGNRRHAFQSTATQQPIFLKNQLTGYPAIQFDGIDDYLDLGAAQLISYTGSWAAILVANFTNINTCIFGAGAENDGGYDNWAIQMRGGFHYAYTDTGSLISSDFQDPATETWNIHIWSRKDELFRSYINGVQVSSNDTSYPLRGGSSGYVAHNILGANYNQGNIISPFNGFVTDFIILQNQTISGMNIIGNYFKSKYSLDWVNVT